MPILRPRTNRSIANYSIFADAASSSRAFDYIEGRAVDGVDDEQEEAQHSRVCRAGALGRAFVGRSVGRDLTSVAR